MTRHPKIRRPEPGGYQTWINSWRLSLEAEGLSKRTVTLYVDVAQFFAGWLRHTRPALRDWDEVGRDELRAFFAWMRERGEPCPHALRDPAAAPPACAGYGKGYINNAGRSLQQFFGWYAEEEDLPNPFVKVAVPAAPRADEAPPPVLEAEQLQALVRDAERGRDFESRRDTAILRLFMCTGTRLAELALLQLDDINLQRREARVTGKGSRQRIVPFDQRAALALDRYIRVRTKHPAAHLPALWLGVRRRQAMTPNGVYQMLVRRGLVLGVRIYPHLLRHTFAHRWLDAGGAEGDLMALAGWDSNQMLRHYGRSAKSARARRAYDRIDVMGGI
ncbi:tyrosine-type recombinase/integrase [Micromonospora chalcea]|uniref:tyrosine-type recombinase/integrase n=1 Tax=Micromonospora chalcea TaxID=1874 RepID=UPI0021A2CEC0|nr:tyrosine-type recombinase/integrase [Micromonospora chalcea]MCT2280391.1 tyrosine-type recombinase/integrase [Micromonospora chalcea]